MQPLFLTPVFQERIWGGTALQDEFGYNISSDKTGECWAISAHPSGTCTIKNGIYAGKSLSQLWDENQELFGYSNERVFPLLTKILDANMDLSVQVHPDDQYAKVHENGELGKTECWYIIDCKEGAEIVFGHTARTKDELEQQIKAGNWEDLLQRVKIKPGDFFYVPSGTIHALCEGTLVLETQQSSDTTYRLYDYDRLDDQGNPRELHLDKSIAVTTVPHTSVKTDVKVETHENAQIITFIKSSFFSVYKWIVTGKMSFSINEKYLLCSVLNGTGTLREGNGDLYSLNKGDHFIIPVGFGSFILDGNIELIVSHS